MANVHQSVSNDGKGNTYHDTTKNTWFDHISNKGGFKVNVMGDVGDNVKNYLINLNDIQTLNLNNVGLVNLEDPYTVKSTIVIDDYP